MDHELTDFLDAVRYNCRVADAQWGRSYSLCTYLLKMRELYRWEMKLPFSASLPKDELGFWLARRESQWEKLEEAPFQPLPLDGQSLDPFDVEAVNRNLLERGLVYGAGLGNCMSPQFFLANLEERWQENGVDVRVAGEEYARELSSPPATWQDGVVCVRRQSLARLIWERVEEWRWKKQDNAMGRAVAGYGLDRGCSETALSRMTRAETPVVIWHELGEARAESLLGPRWLEAVAAVAGSRGEFVLRAVRDLLADCLETLPRLLAGDKPAAIHFYFANFSGLRGSLAPELKDAYQSWHEGGGAAKLEAGVEAGAKRWLEEALGVLEDFATGGDRFAAAVKARFPPP